MFIRVRDPGLADRATSLKAVRDLRDAHVLGHALALANTEVLQASLNQLNEAVHTYRIRLRGTLDRSKPPMEIDELEQQIGVLDVWENTLTCDGRVYRDIRRRSAHTGTEVSVTRHEQSPGRGLRQSCAPSSVESPSLEVRMPHLQCRAWAAIAID